MKLSENAAATGKFTRMMARALATKKANVEIFTSDSHGAINVQHVSTLCTP